MGDYSDLMVKGEWKFHAQGIILDKQGNILTGQKRLWAIIYSGVPQYMRISKGSPQETADFIDRGTSQTSRDLASRKTERKHSPMEQSISRGMLALHGNIKPTVDDIANCLSKKSEILESAIKNTRRIKKTKACYMVMAAICELCDEEDKDVVWAFGMMSDFAEKLETELYPVKAEACWNKGAAFTLAMEKAISVCKRMISSISN